VRATGLQALKDWKNKFCPQCLETFGNRLKALQLQVEHGKPITEIIVEAGRFAFTAFGEDGWNFFARFAQNLGVAAPTLHDWLRFFFGMSWADFKRTQVCAARSCTVVDTSGVTATPNRRSPLRSHGWSKYYPVIKLRERGICSCPIRRDNLILVDRPPAALQADSLAQLFRIRPKWVDQLRVVSGSHRPLLDEQEDVE